LRTVPDFAISPYKPLAFTTACTPSYSNLNLPQNLNRVNTLLLTLSISTTKKSICNKLEKTSKTFQHFKNLLYLCALEYHKNTKGIKPFLSFAGKKTPFREGGDESPQLRKHLEIENSGNSFKLR